MKRYFLVLCLFLLNPLPARAHNIGAECSLKNGQVHVDAYFDDGTPAAAARVQVLDAAEKPVAMGKTDAKGQWSFPAPAPGKYQAIVEPGAGHRAKVSFTIPKAKESPAPEKKDAPRTVSEGPSRAEFTRFPWLKASIGVGAIFLFSGAFLVARRRGRGSQGKLADGMDLRQ